MQKNIQKAILSLTFYEFLTFFLMQYKEIHIFAVMHNHYLSHLLWTKISMNFLRFFYCNTKKFIYLHSCITIISLTYYEQKSLWISYLFSTLQNPLTKIYMNFLRFFCNTKKFIYLLSCITIISMTYVCNISCSHYPTIKINISYS